MILLIFNVLENMRLFSRMLPHFLFFYAHNITIVFSSECNKSDGNEIKASRDESLDYVNLSCFVKYRRSVRRNGATVIDFQPNSYIYRNRTCWELTF